MDPIPMSSKALSQLEEQCEHEVMTQRKVEEKKKREEWWLFCIW